MQAALERHARNFAVPSRQDCVQKGALARETIEVCCYKSAPAAVMHRDDAVVERLGRDQFKPP